MSRVYQSIMEMKCMLKVRYGSECNNSKPCTSNKGPARIDSIIKVYRDDLHVGLEQQIEEDENLTVYFHRNCVSRYISSTNIARLRSRNFVILKHHLTFFLIACLYCGDNFFYSFFFQSNLLTQFFYSIF